MPRRIGEDVDAGEVELERGHGAEGDDPLFVRWCNRTPDRPQCHVCSPLTGWGDAFHSADHPTAGDDHPKIRSGVGDELLNERSVSLEPRTVADLEQPFE